MVHQIGLGLFENEGPHQFHSRMLCSPFGTGESPAQARCDPLALRIVPRNGCTAVCDLFRELSHDRGER
jgi:hypothetical protein